MSTAEPPMSTDFNGAGDQASALDVATLTMLEQECEGALEHLLRLFLSECEKRVAQIESFGMIGNAELEREAHTVKGAAISFGCPALSAAALDLEVAAARGEASLHCLVRAVVDAHRAARAAMLLRYPDLQHSAGRP